MFAPPFDKMLKKKKTSIWRLETKKAKDGSSFVNYLSSF